MKAMKDMKVMKKSKKSFFMIFLSFTFFMSSFWALHAQTQSTEAAPVLVRIETPFGNIDLALDVKHAPVTSANFLKYVDAGLYNGGRFNRVTRPDNYTPTPPNRPMMELIQGGISPDRASERFPAIPLERTSVTGLKHVVGTLSMARGGPDSATSEFFLLLNDQPSLDFGGMRFDDGQGAAAFGKVVAGLDVVRTIQAQPVQSKDQNPQSLNPPVPIVKVYRLVK
jgi:peptidyl-prolyl cis-trans isomerase A (cyclophilin A)